MTPLVQDGGPRGASYDAPVGYRRRRLRVALVSVARDAFKGDAERVATRAHDWLESRADGLGYEVAPQQPTIHEPGAAREVAAWAAGADLDYLLVLHATFATTDLLAPLLRTRTPVGVWAMPESEGLPGRRASARADADPLPLNSLCGMTLTLSSLGRDEVARDGPVKWFYGAPGDEDLELRWSVTTRALHAFVALRGASVLLIGGAAPGFYRLQERPELAEVRVDVQPLEALYARMASFDADAVGERVATWRRVEPALEAPDDDLVVSARTLLALEALAREGGHGAVALRCWPEFPERCAAVPCAAVGSMADGGLPTACEGDVMGALSMLALQATAGRPSALMDLSDLDRGSDALFLWHCGNAPRAMAATGTRLTTHFNRDGVGVVRDMRIAPGPVTAFRLLEGGRRAVVITADIAPLPERSFDGVGGWCRSLRWDGEPRTAPDVVAQVLDERLPHHLALVSGDHGEAMHELAVMLGAAVLPPGRTRPALIASGACFGKGGG